MAKQTLDEKTDDFITALIADGLDCGAVMHRKIERAYRLSMKIQDKDTRHACAETIVDLDSVEVNSVFDKERGWLFTENNEVSAELIGVTEAHNAIMNCRKGIE